MASGGGPPKVVEGAAKRGVELADRREYLVLDLVVVVRQVVRRVAGRTDVGQTVELFKRNQSDL